MEEQSQIFPSMLNEDATIKEDLDAAKDARKDSDTCILPKDSCLIVPSKHLSASKRKQNILPGQLSPAYLFPYLVLIKNCIHWPFPTIEKQCLAGEILCRIDSLTLNSKEKTSLLVPAKQQTFKETTYVTFEGLEDLQWKLFKGLAKRKPKTTRIWKSGYSHGLNMVVIPEAKEYLLPLVSKDWIIDGSLKVPKEMVFHFFRTDTHL